MFNATSKTASIIMAEIKMSRADRVGAVFLVEGETDSRFWRLHINPQCHLVDCGGRNTVFAVAALTEEQQLPDTAGVYDADYDVLLGIQPHYPKTLIPTDENDLDICLLKSKAFGKVVKTYASNAWIKTEQDPQGLTLQKHVEDESQTIGMLRLLCKLGVVAAVDFGQLKPHRFVPQTKQFLDKDELYVQFAHLTNLRIQALKLLLAQHQPKNTTQWQLSQGHDALSLLSIAFKHQLGVSMSEGQLRKALSLSFDRAMLETTSMFHSLVKLQEKFSQKLFVVAPPTNTASPP